MGSMNIVLVINDKDNYSRPVPIQETSIFFKEVNIKIIVITRIKLFYGGFRTIIIRKDQS